MVFFCCADKTCSKILRHLSRQFSFAVCLQVCTILCMVNANGKLTRIYVSQYSRKFLNTRQFFQMNCRITMIFTFWCGILNTSVVTVFIQEWLPICIICTYLFRPSNALWAKMQVIYPQVLSKFKVCGHCSVYFEC